MSGEGSGTEGERESWSRPPLSREPNVGPHIRTLRSRPVSRSRASHLTHSATQVPLDISIIKTDGVLLSWSSYSSREESKIIHQSKSKSIYVVMPMVIRKGNSSYTSFSEQMRLGQNPKLSKVVRYENTEGEEHQRQKREHLQWPVVGNTDLRGQEGYGGEVARLKGTFRNTFKACLELLDKQRS